MFSVKEGIEKVCFIHSITKNGVALHSRQRLESSRVGQEYGLENDRYIYRIYGHMKSTVFRDQVTLDLSVVVIRPGVE